MKYLEYSLQDFLRHNVEITVDNMYDKQEAGGILGFIINLPWLNQQMRLTRKTEDVYKLEITNEIVEDMLSHFLKLSSDKMLSFDLQRKYDLNQLYKFLSKVKEMSGQYSDYLESMVPLIYNSIYIYYSTKQ